MPMLFVASSVGQQVAYIMIFQHGITFVPGLIGSHRHGRELQS